MKIDTNDLNPGTSFLFDEDNPDEGSVTIRLANGDTMEKITKACVKKRAEYRRGQRFEVIDDNESKRSDMLWNYVIVDWKGVEDLNGNAIPCTEENKKMLMRGSVKFAGFVGNCVEKLSEITETYDEDLEKNLPK